MTAPYAIGFVSGWEITHPFFLSVFTAARKHHCSILSMLSGPVLHRARNELVRMYLRDCDERYLLMVDSDIEFTTDDIDKALAHDAPIVSGIYPKTQMDTGAEGMEIVEDGCGFLLVRRDVYERLGEFPFNPIKIQTGEVTGEDVGFRYHAGEAGFDIIVDPAISLGHLKSQVLRIPADALVPA